MKSETAGRDRIRDAQRGMRLRAKTARIASHAFDKDSQHAASLRGKARGYEESADMIEAVLRGGFIHRKWSLRPFSNRSTPSPELLPIPQEGE